MTIVVVLLISLSILVILIVPSDFISMVGMMFKHFSLVHSVHIPGIWLLVVIFCLVFLVGVMGMIVKLNNLRLSCYSHFHNSNLFLPRIFPHLSRLSIAYSLGAIFSYFFLGLDDFVPSVASSLLACKH